MGDMAMAEYQAKGRDIDEELDRLAPRPVPDLAGARAILDDFALFWNQEKRRDLVRSSSNGSGSTPAGSSNPANRDVPAGLRVRARKRRRPPRP